MKASDNVAFFLDFDGTLVDIAPTPEEVIVSDGLRDTLLSIREKFGDALAIVTGRPIEQIDQFLPDVPFAVAGEHGIALRHFPGGETVRANLPEIPRHWIEEAQTVAKEISGVRVEQKKAGLVLHFRGAPHAEDNLRRLAERWVGGDTTFHIQSAKMAWEIRPDGINKGNAVVELMKCPPFAGRLPIFIGDDVTDGDGISAASALGGGGMRLPDDFENPAALKAWLARVAAGDISPWERC